MHFQQEVKKIRPFPDFSYRVLELQKTWETLYVSWKLTWECQREAGKYFKMFFFKVLCHDYGASLKISCTETIFIAGIWLRAMSLS